MKKQILKDFVLTEISGVDRPAQPTAKVSIMKRAEDAGDSGEVKKTESPMTELEKAVAELAKAKAELEVTKALAAMSDAEKEFVAKMGDKDKEDYMKMSDEDKKKKMADMKKNDETVVFDGKEVSKRAVGDEAFTVLKALTKQAAETAERLEKAEQAAVTARLEKRAETEFGHMAGDVSKKVALLAAIEKMDGDAKEYALSVLKAQNALAEEAATKKGSVAKKADENTTLEKRVAEIRKADSKLTEAQAFVKALEENPELYEVA
jgi:hypothetical protein